MLIASPRLPAPIAAVACLAVAMLALPSVRAEPGWVAETPHFRVIAPVRPGVDAVTARSAAEDLESVRAQALSEGLGPPRHSDGPVEVLLVATRLELHLMLRDPLDSRTHGITIRGSDHDVAIVPWHELPGPRVTLAHEYAHQLEDRDWPLWFREGRAVHLARRMPLRSGADPLATLLNQLERLVWLDWAELLAAQRDSATAAAELFQTQSWLLVHWLAATVNPLARLVPEDATEALERLGAERLTKILLAHLDDLRLSRPDGSDPVEVVASDVDVRPAAEWEIPLFAAEVSRDLRFLDSAERSMTRLADQFPEVARVQAAYGALLQLLGRLDESERRFGQAVQLGDSRARTAYRYASLLMRPGTDIESRTADALRFALLARDAMPREPVHQLAVAQARMLQGDWEGAFQELRALAVFPGWKRQADREAREIGRRRAQSLRTLPAPAIAAEIPVQRVPVDVPRDLQARKQPPAPAGPATSRRWPPYGTWLSHGRIAWVDCSEDVKKVVVHTPYSRIVLRISEVNPPQLINRPFSGKSLPCEGRGWWGAFAYEKRPGEAGIDGDLVGIRF